MSDLKNFNGIAAADLKNYNGIAKADLKTINGLTAASSIIVMEDDFTGETIDTSKWDLASGDGYTTFTQNDNLTINVNNNGADYDDYMISDASVSSGVCAVQFTMNWTEGLGRVGTVGLFRSSTTPSGATLDYHTKLTQRNADDNNDARWDLRLTVDDTAIKTTIAKGNIFKIVYDFSATSVKLYYWNSTVWTQYGATKTSKNLHQGDGLKVGIFGNGNITTDPVVVVDNLYFTNEDYATATPS